MIYKNALITTKDFSFVGFIEIDDSGIVLEIKEGNTEKSGIDCSGLIIMPGFIDSHTHGGYGMAFDDIGEEHFVNDYVNYLKNLVKEGVVAFVGTTVTSKLERLEKSSILIDDLSKTNITLPKLAAWYYEGPFISIVKKGAHEQDLIIPLNEPFLKKIKKNILIPIIFTVAPEVENNTNLIEKYKNDFIFALGHSNANFEESKRSLENGIKRITHLYNAMSGFHHHDMGILNAIFNKVYKDDLNIEIISDGVHVDNEVIKYSYNNISIKNISIVSDSLPPKGFSDGKYKLGNLPIDKEGNWFYLEGTKTLSGGACPYIYLVKNFKDSTNCSLQELVMVSSYNAARNLKMDENFGDIVKGKKANIVFLDKNIEYVQSYINGHLWK
ncbi:MAG: amidohydrolase family protein [Mycoplasmataceae bacterium]|nr:amidohydrolase family protein [Mycoplasmataceae bacterium]